MTLSFGSAIGKQAAFGDRLTSTKLVTSKGAHAEVQSELLSGRSETHQRERGRVGATASVQLPNT